MFDAISIMRDAMGYVAFPPPPQTVDDVLGDAHAVALATWDAAFVRQTGKPITIDGKRLLRCVKCDLPAYPGNYCVFHQPHCFR